MHHVAYGYEFRVILKHFFEPRLAQSSYLVGCAATGDAIVIDPLRSTDPYIEAAGAEGLRIAAVAETHIHADYASGALALARKTRATLHVSGEGGREWQYAFARAPGVRAIHHGDVLRVGRLRFDVIHTPGHTPEHVTLIVTDEAASSHPFAAFTGDFLFAGDVGRPDLLEKSPGERDTTEAAAKQLFQSVRAFAWQPDSLLVWPGHGAGSACGRSLGAVPATSIGYERLTNWALKTLDEAAFVSTALLNQPDPPRYFGEMKRVNRAGAPKLRPGAALCRITAQEVPALVASHAEFVDLRPNATADGYLLGSIVVPLTRSFLAHAGSVLRYGMPVYVVAADVDNAVEAIEALRLIAIDDVRGWIPEPAVDGYRAEGGTLETLVSVDASQALDLQATGHVLLDVRSTAEWQTGHIPNAMHAPLTRLLDDVRGLGRDTPLVVYCQTGARSRIAGTALRRVGFTHVVTLADGYAGVLAAAQHGVGADQAARRPPAART